MPILKQSDRKFTPVPIGAHPARCFAMISLGTQKSANPQYQPSFKIVLMFEFPTETIKVGEEVRPMTTTMTLNAYLGSPSKPSNTNKFLVSWRGRPFTDAELKGFDISKVVGVPCLINIVHEEKDGTTYDKVASISPMPKGMACPAQHHKSVVYEIEDGKNATYQALPEWLQKKIAACMEWQQPAPGEAPQQDAPPDDATDPKADDETTPF